MTHDATSDAILFTAFEPSGDEHAAPVIAALRRLDPQRPVFAFGGPLMEAAGATIIERTTDNAVMLGDALSQAMAHRRRVKRLAAWLKVNPIARLVPVDSPAANWAICAAVRKLQPQARVIHLVAPQLWAWAPWRIHRMRRLSDHVLCLLPFEEAWFGKRNMPATFVGHPVFNDEAAEPAPLTDAPHTPAHAVKIALLPGSRMGEIKANLATMLEVLSQVRRRHPQAAAVIAARDEAGAARIRQVMQAHEQAVGRFDDVALRIGQTPSVLAWADAVLAVSGTVTLHVLARRKPMVVFYNVNWWLAQVARLLVQTRTFTLPNLIGEHAGMGRVVPEFVPHFGQVAPLTQAMLRIIDDKAARAAQIEKMHTVAATFNGHDYANEAANAILGDVGRGTS